MKKFLLKPLLLTFCIALGCSRRPAQEEDFIDLKALSKNAGPAVVLLIVSDADGKELATGTGFFVSSDGKLITNHHVIEGGARTVAKTKNGGLFPVEGVLADDPTNDLALLKLKGRDLPFLLLGNSEKIEVGTRIAVIGSPLGLEGTLSEGIVSAVRDLAGEARILQITAAISHGSSGSPVLNAKGEVVGVATLVVRDGQALNFAVPAEKAKSLLVDAPRKLTPPKPERQADLRKQIEEQTSALRGLPFKKPVTYKAIGRDELRKVLEGKLAEQYNSQELRDYGRAFEALGLIPEGTDLAEAILSLYDEQVAAFYVPEEQALYTFKDESFTKNLDRVTLAHELTHALQDQNFDLLKFPLKIKDNDDLALATSALVEGDATLLMAQYYGEHLDVRNLLGDVMGGMLGQKTAKFQAAPPFLQQLLLFPYQEGTEFAMAVFAAGGIDALNDAFKHPPVSSQQILHPDKFLHDRHDPETIALKKLDAPGSPSAAQGWRLIADNVLGEFGIRCLISQHLGAFEALIAAKGWDGDRYHIYERGTNGPTVLVWTTAWESEQAAIDFADAYQRVAGKRGVTAKLERDGARVCLRQAKDAGTLDELK